MFFKHSLRPSFTLIELSIALSVIGILSAVGISAYKSSNPELKQDLKKMQAIEDKLQEFFNVNGRLPFPANSENEISHTKYLLEIPTSVAQEPVCVDEVVYCVGECCASENDYNNPYYEGMEYVVWCYYPAMYSSISFNVSQYTKQIKQTCSGGSNQTNILWGIVPTRTLGLPDDYAYDSQGHNFEYITNAYIATANGTETQSGYKKSNYITSNDGKYQVLLTATNNTSPNKAITLTGLSIYNNKTNKQIQTTADNTAYVIMSKGKTNKCFFNTRTSTSVNENKPTGNLLKNCVSNYDNNSSTERTIYQGYSKEFDNVVKYRTMNEIVVSSYKADEKAQGLGSNNANTTEGYFNALPKGTMVMFYLNSNNIPQGWQICDGTNGTPDMRGVVAVGVGQNSSIETSSYNLGDVGGSENAHLTRTKDVEVNIEGTAITIEQMPSHNHNNLTSYGGNHKHLAPVPESRAGTWNNFGSPSAIYNYYGADASKITWNTNNRAGMNVGTDNDNGFLLTSKPVTYDSCWGETIYSEIQGLKCREKSQVFINLYHEGQFVDNYGNHAHVIEPQGGGETHTHAITITQPEFSLSNTSSSTIDKRTPYVSVYYICKIS